MNGNPVKDDAADVKKHITDAKASDAQHIHVTFLLPSGTTDVVTFESFVTKADLKRAIRQGLD